MWYHTSRPDPGFKVFSPRTAGFLAPNRGVSQPNPRVSPRPLSFAPTLEFRPDPWVSPRPLSFEPTLGVPTRPSGVSRPDPRGFLQETLRLRHYLVLLYAAISIYHWILFDMLYTLRKIFHQSTSVATYWQKTDIHMNSKAWLLVNGPWFMFSSPQALQT